MVRRVTDWREEVDRAARGGGCGGSALRGGDAAAQCIHGAGGSGGELV